MQTTRLNCIISYVNSEVVADIGCDHAYCATEIIRQNRAKKVIAADVRKGPLNAAIENIKKNKMEDKIETRLGSGLSVLKKGEADTAIIAGMGGELIEMLLRDDEDMAKSMTLILQPMNNQYELRHYLIENGYRIIKEDIECEGERVYNIVVVTAGKMEPFSRDIFYHIPEYLMDNKHFEALFNKKKREFKKIVAGLKNSKDCDREKLSYFERALRELEEIKK